MTTRRITIDADPAACADGLAVLAALRRAGRDGLDGSIAALTAIVEKGEAKTKHRDWREVPTHLAREHDESRLTLHGVKTWCCMAVTLDSMARPDIQHTYECVTDGSENLINVTDHAELATCHRCLRAKAAQEKRDGRKKPQTGDVG